MPKIRDKYSQKMKLRGLVPNFHIHVNVSDLYIPMIGPPILLSSIAFADPEINFALQLDSILLCYHVIFFLNMVFFMRGKEENMYREEVMGKEVMNELWAIRKIG